MLVVELALVAWIGVAYGSSDRGRPGSWYAARAKIATLASAIRMYRNDMGEYPDSLPTLARAKYLDERSFVDPWGRHFGYRAPANRSDDAFGLWSDGPDGKNGSADDVSGPAITEMPISFGSPSGLPGR
ncbi:MAG: type II secretion system protein GspG [Phycisphaerae bacterium]